MAGDSRANSDFNQILSGIDRKFEIIHTKWTEDKLFEVKFRTQIPRDNDDFNALCDEWVDLFSEITTTVWAKKISNTGPKIRFRKQYQCWTQGGKVVQKELLFDARRCKATLDMKVLTDNPLTRRKNKHIRLGLNVVVKINFIHLHKVDTTLPYAFFVHNCEPQPEAPKPIAHPNDKLPQLVAEMVQKGLNAAPKVAHVNNNGTAMNMHHAINTPHVQDINQIQKTTPLSIEHLKLDCQENMLKIDQVTQIIDQKLLQSDQLIHAQLHLPNMDDQNIQVGQILPMQNLESIKLQVQPQIQQLTQVVVAAPQLDMSEPLLMCQPTIMFDPTQVIPVTSLPHHFVQVHSHNIHNQQGHYL